MALISDRFGRNFRNLRVSLTAACNYACTYCVPNGKRLLAAADEMSGEETITAISLLIETAGINKVRLTGGEPLLSPKFDLVVNQIQEFELDDISITTNGQLLPRKIDVIASSGIKRINVSLDTLDENYFRKISRSGDLDTVLTGISMLQKRGITIKVNMVPMRGHNDQQILQMLDYCLANNIELRFIELMKMGHLQHSRDFEAQFFGLHDILRVIGDKYDFKQLESPKDSTAIRYCVENRGRFGIIANESEPFCGGCNRLRLSANARIYGCLSSSKSHDIRKLLSLPREKAVEEMTEILGLAIATKQQTSFRGETTVMKFIGG